MRCVCGFDNSLDSRFCGRCGAPVSAHAAPPADFPAATSAAVAVATLPAAAHTPAATARIGARRSPIQPRTLTAVIVLAGLFTSGYWWWNRPQGRYVPDNGGLYSLVHNGKYGFMNKTGELVIPPQFDDAEDFSEGLAAVGIGGKYGFIDRTGTLVITPQFNKAYRFQFGRAAVAMGTVWGHIDADGKFITAPVYIHATSYFDGLASVMRAGSSADLVDRRGTVVASGISVGEFSGGLAPASNAAGRFGFVDTKGRWRIEPQFDRADTFAEGLAPVEVGGRVGYVTTSGKFAINPRFTGAEPFSEGRARFTSDEGKVGYIDRGGVVVIEPKFLDGGRFSEGRAVVDLGDANGESSYGYIDPAGKVVIPAQFQTAGAFQQGLARVWVGGRMTYVTPAGALVPDPFPGRMGLTTRTVREKWGLSPTSTPQFLLERTGGTISGFHRPDGSGPVFAVTGTSEPDGSITLRDERGSIWTGRFRSSVLIEFSDVKDQARAAASSGPSLVYLQGDATEEDFGTAVRTREESRRHAAQRAATEQTIPGEWLSTRPLARLSLTKATSGFNGVLLNGLWRETLAGSLRPDNTLELVGQDAQSLREGVTEPYALDTFILTLSSDGSSLSGSFKDTAGRTGHYTFARTGTEADAVASAARTADARTVIPRRLAEASAAFERRDYQRAIDLCDDILSLDSDHREARDLRARVQRTLSVLGR